MLWIVLTEVSCCVVKRFDAALELSLDETSVDARQAPVRLGSVPLTAVAGIARLHTNKGV